MATILISPDLPKNTISGLIGLPRAENSNIASQSSLHQVSFTIELSRLTRLARLNYLARLVHEDRNFPFLNKSI